MSHGPIWYNKEKCIIPFRFYFWIQVRGGGKYHAIKLCVRKKRIGKRRKRSKIGSINGLQEVGLSDVLRDFHLGVAQKLLTQCENDNFSWLILGCLLCCAIFDRFCCDDYVEPRASTVGIDLSIRCLPIGDDNQYCALQFWDTAGKRNS